MFDREEFERWLSQAEYTLRSAENDMKAGFYSWACFKAQQAAEYAVKALLFALGIMAYGHSIKRLLDVLSKEVDVPEELFDSARLLDRHYIPPRYPDAYIEGAPYEYYGEKDAVEAINSSLAIMAFVRRVADEVQ
jgi:HEPN domain-containing protein